MVDPDASTGEESTSVQGDVTRLLIDLRSGRAEAADELMPRVYRELRDIAAAVFRRGPGGHTLQPTALVNEAFLKLVHKRSVEWKDREHFFAFSSRLMRELLVDHERERRALKRGGDRQRVTLDEQFASSSADEVDLLDLNDALDVLAQRSERQARLVELRYFAGLDVDESARALSISTTTAERDWRQARAWLGLRLAGSDS